MKGIENISEKILGEAREKAIRTLDDAGIRASEIEMREHESAKAQADEIITGAQKRTEDIIEQRRLSSNIEIRKILAAQKQDMIEKAFSEAQKKVQNLPEDEYTQLLSRLAADACSDGQGGELLLCQKDAKLGKKVRDAANKVIEGEKLTLSDDFADINGGVVIRRGSIEINCGFDIIFKMLRNDIARDVAELLFASANLL